MKANKIKRIVVHCTAGYGSIQSIKNYWFKVLGWKTGGYHIVVDKRGAINILYPFSKVVNGVRGFNTSSIHISYVGGVEKNNYKVATDTRTKLQKIKIEQAINMALDWIAANGGDVTKVEILGHRDLSPDTNHNGIIESWERIKECPSFDAIPEYKHLRR